jgi:hypothetical protein
MPDAKTLPPTDELTHPIPPRYWWLKRILLATGVLVVALVILRLWWGWEAERRLEAKIAEYRAAGQPVTLEDFQFPPVPDDDNAAKLLQDAAAAIVTPGGLGVSLDDVFGDIRLVEEHADEVGKLVEANADALRRARQARSRPGTDWKLGMRSPVINVILPDLSSQRHLAKLLCTAALYQHHTGDDAESVETIGDVLEVAERVGEMPFLISEFVSIAIYALADTVVEQIAPNLLVDIGSPEPTGASVAPARQEQLRALITTLLDDEPLREAWRFGMYGERLMCLDSTNLVASGQVNMGALTGGPWLPRPLTVALGPMFICDGVFMMEYETAFAEAGSAASFPDARARMPRYPSFDSGIKRNMHSLSHRLLPTLDRALELHFQSIAKRHMAATALAIRLYELEHGRQPESLDQLVPHYVTGLPSDPFASDGQPLGYRRDAVHPVIYSVGLDGVDDGGEWELDSSGDVSRDSKDLVFFLNADRPRVRRQPLTTQPASDEAVESQGEEVGDGGQADQCQPPGE